MKCGIIMQISSTEITVLTPEGDFIKLNKERKDYQIGEEVRIDVTNSKPIFSKKNGWKLKILVPALAAAVFLIVCFFPAFLTNSKVSAYVSMDVKSSIELGITDELKVVEVKGINEEGKEIIARLKEWKGRDMDDVISEMVTLNRSAGHLKTNSNILFSTVMIEKDNRNFEYSLQKKLTDTQDIPQIDNSVNIEMKKASVKDRQEATDIGISTGTYLEQTNKKTKNQPSTGVKKNDKIKVTEEKSNHKSSSVEKVEIKQQTSNSSDRTQIPNKSAVIQENKQGSVEVPKKAGTVTKDAKAIHTTEEKAVKQQHKDNNSKQRPPSKDQPINKEVRKDTIQKERKTNQNKRDTDRNKQQVDKRNKPNKQPYKSRKQDQVDKRDVRKQDQVDKRDVRKPQHQRGKQDERNQNQKRKGMYQ
ncbi:anti-sigma factor domain-containing protein [Bacillus sp. FJAT-27986]|uniref:anti-sigma factor domain-containing protein n=1 Tax=Bacillus sp. FJAT-27986 TaxID=1743146 RepID=UPI00080ACA1A|nr:anti-sigma factor domain-containing protein [Bacillus sp. FJAT-27986]OCA89804.1 hypothetical protein A8L44_02370 [Bacillus sp. FJAT-27986]